MSNSNNYLLKGAMAYGMSMGVFWVIKYLFFILSFKVSFLGVIYWGMTAVVPYLAYLLTQKYKHQIGQSISFLHAMQFGILIHFFAALIVSLEHYIFFKFLAPPGYLQMLFQQSVEMFEKIQMSPSFMETIKSMGPLTEIEMTIQEIMGNVLYGTLFYIPVAIIVSIGHSSKSSKQENIKNTIE